VSRWHDQDRRGDQAQALIDADKVSKRPGDTASKRPGDTVSKAAKRCDIDDTTVFRWRHRCLAALTLDKPERLGGILAADQRFILGLFHRPARQPSRPGAHARRQGGQTASVQGTDPG
jgi:hypothetical protein